MSSPPWVHAQTHLAPGTVPILKGVVSGAVVGQPVPIPGGNLLVIQQNLADALIDWTQFNIASGSVVKFDQPNSSAVALNRIFDLSPSIIDGKLTANGQIWLINQNGIIFGQGSQVNTNTLIASTLNISDSLLTNGLTSSSAAAFSGGYAPDGTPTAATPAGTIQIGGQGSGAAPQISTPEGGTIIMVSPRINNQSGVITSPDGQVILAAGNSVYLAQASPTATPNVRGYVVQITADSGPVNLTSLIANAGTVSADRGNVTLAALAVNQGGRVSATSSALYNGTVVLEASSQSGQGGTVTLLPGSVTETPIDTSDPTKLAASETFAGGSISISGKTIINEGTISAPGGVIALAANDVNDPLGSRIYLAPGSVTNAAGDWSTVPYSSTLQSLRVTTNELDNAPDQKGGILEGATVTVNLDEPSTILDLSGYQATQLQSVAQKAAAGGTVSLVSSGSVIARPGSILDVQGGGTQVLSGLAALTELIGADGKLYNINSAPEAMRYVGIFGTYDVDHPRWGRTQDFTYNIGLNVAEPGFVQGAAAGAINVQAGAGVILDGNVVAGVTVGPTQLTDAPRGGSLTVGSSNAAVPDYGIQNVTFSNKPQDSLGAAFDSSTALSAQNLNQTNLSATLLSGASGLDSLSVNANSTITVPRNVTLAVPIGGSIALAANQVNVAGDVTAPSGTITLTGQRTITSGTVQAGVNANPDGVVVLAGTSRVNATGVWINTDGVDGATVGPVLPSALRNADATTTSTLGGGSVSLSAATIDVASGSSIDVSGGGSINSKGVIAGGAAGTIAIGAPGALLNDPLHTALTQLSLDGQLSGYSLATGGTLRVSAPVVSIGTESAPASGQTFAVQPAFFTENGFSSYALTGADQLVLAPSINLSPLTTSEVVTSLAGQKLVSGGDLESIATKDVLPQVKRPATSINLQVTNPVSAPLEIGQGNSIVVDPTGKITLSAVNGLEVDGRLSAPSGTIALNLNGPVVNGTDGATVPVTIGAKADISTAGTFVAAASPIGIVTGSIQSGGTIDISAVNASVLAAPGSVLDVSGTGQLVDVFTGAGQNKYVPELLGSNAGVLEISATDGITLQGALVGKPGTAKNAGGSFVLELTDRNNSVLPANYDLPREVVVVQNGATPLPADAASSVVAGVTVAQLEHGGFDLVRMQSEDSISFAGVVNANFARGITIDAPEYVLEGGANVTLQGAEVAMINSFGTRQSDPNGITNGVNSPFNGSIAAAVPTSIGDGILNLHGGNVDLYGSLTINGAHSVNVVSVDDIRFSGRRVVSTGSESATLIGGLTTTADVSFTAAQLYPTTESDFSVNLLPASTSSADPGRPLPAGVLTIASNGQKPSEVLSAGGELNFSANLIDQGGVVKAPLGELNFQAASQLTLESGSTTSVSAKGLLIPFGETEAGVQWLYGPTNFVAGVSELTAAPGKLIAMSSPNVVQKPGALINLAGGGDVYASEFVPGSGGSSDITQSANTFVIIPNSNLAVSPFDPDIVSRNNIGSGFSPTQNRDGSVYNTIQIGPGAAVPAGSYALLPALYAFVPGAYLVQLETGSAFQNLQADSSASLANGASIAVGHLSVAGTGIVSSSTVGVLLQPGSAIAKYSDYTITTSDFFTRQALESSSVLPITPSGAGSLQIAAVNQLQLAGTFSTAAAPGGDAATVDISASKIALVNQTGQASIDPSYLQISTANLSNIDANLLIGGVRTDLPATTSSGASVQLTTTATDIVVANTAAAPLKAPELILAASDAITVQSGSVLEGTGSVTGRSANITTDPGSALIRLANSAQIQVVRPVVDNTTGTIIVQPGTVLEADQSALLNATKSTTLNGAIEVANGGSLAFTAPTILLGDSGSLAASENGLALSNAALGNFSHLGSLVMQSTGSIDFFGSTTLGSSSVNLTLDAPALSGMTGVTTGAPAQAQILANNLLLVNSSGTDQTAASGHGTLAVNAASITIDAGAKAITGFQNVNLKAASDVTFSGAGSLYVAGNTTVQASDLTVAGGAQQTLTTLASGATATPYNLDLTGNGAQGAQSEVGGQLTLSANAIADAIPIIAKSGSVTLLATGTGASAGIELASGASIDTSGTSKSFNGERISVSGGSISLIADGGTIAIDVGAQLTVAGAAQGSNAGSIFITAPVLSVEGILSGSAPTGFQQGAISLDLGTLTNFSALNASINQGGFDYARDLRVRNGDIVVATTDNVVANAITLSADRGAIDVFGTLDASSLQGGGSIALFAQGPIDLAPGSLLSVRGTSQDASATGPASNGGSVDVQTLQSTTGALTFENGATIDIRPGIKGAAGSVVFNAPQMQDATQIYDQVPVTLNGTVLSASAAVPTSGSITVEGNRVYQNAAPQASDLAGYAADYASFVTNVNSGAILAGLKSDTGSAVTNATVTGSVELQSAGNLEIDSTWDLTSAAWNTGAPSMLTIRAAGDLTVNAAIGLPNTNLPSGPSWNVRLVGGADLSAADPMAVQSLTALGGTGNVLLPLATSAVRTGTGNIQIAAGTDFNLSSPLAVVTTAGEVALPDGANNRWAHDGGNITISAQQDVLGATSDEWVTDWIRRPTGSPVQASYNGSWWVYRPNFQQNIGALGGGNIDIEAGNNIENLSAAIPTSGDVTKDASGTPSLAVFGGGNLNVSAGGQLDGGSYLVGLGAAAIKAGGSIGSVTPPEFYEMGQSSDPSLSVESLSVTAGGSLSIQSILNPTALFLTRSTGKGPSFTAGADQATFFTYSANASANLVAKGGDLTLGVYPLQQDGLSANDANNLSIAESQTSVLPPILSMAALNGNITTSAGVDAPAVLYPSTQGQLQVFAAKGISNLVLGVSDYEPSVLPNWSNAADLNWPYLASAGNSLAASASTALLPPVGTQPTTPRIVTRNSTDPFVFDVQALDGDIVEPNLVLPGSSRIFASGNILGGDADGSLTLQNLAPNQLSIIQAFSGNIVLGSDDVLVGGPGQLIVQAGGSIDLGQSGSGPKLLASGSEQNASLPTSASARITVVAGVEGTVDPQNLAAALAGVKAAGEETTGSPASHAEQARVAMTQFYGASKVQPGDINSYETSIQTTGGSGIDLIAPDGNITVGLTSPQGQTQIGVITNLGGAINSFLSGDFTINTGKVVTAQGGDIMIFTTDGNIDAGRGAKTSVTTPAPQRVCNAQGQCTYELNTGVAGSGIQTVTSNPVPGQPAPPPAGNIFLFAPAGYVNAGEAGITSGGNVFISAQQVLNASNISAAGTSVGVPTVQVGSIAATLAASGANASAGTDSAAADAARAAAQSATSNAADQFAPGLITVEVLGFGSNVCKETDKQCLGEPH